jgi:hypothetical protein
VTGTDFATVGVTIDPSAIIPVLIWNGATFKSGAKFWNGTEWRSDAQIWDGTEWRYFTTAPGG